MKIILLHHVDQLGGEGDVVEVSDGHARNFLFPKHLAVPATESAIHDAANRAAAAGRESERELHELQHLATSLDGQEFTMTVPANESGTLYGSIASPAIAEHLAEHGFRVDPSWVRLEEPIKETDEHAIPLQFPHGLEAEITVIVDVKE